LTSSAVCAQEGAVGKGVNLFSIQKEVALGAQMAQEVRQRTTPIDSAAVREYVERIGLQLASQLPDAAFQYAFSVIADDGGGQIHEPCSLPGGYIFVPAGLILTAQDDAEFAGMLAHAMAHIAERHGTRQASRSEIAHFEGLPVVFMGGWTGMRAAGNERAVPRSFLAFQRGFETEADMLAIKTMAAAGYDPEALVRHIDRTQTEDAMVSRAFSGLPPRGARVSGLKETIQGLGPRTYSSRNEITAIQTEVRRLLPSGEAPPPSLKRKD
jgi:predicted Zn-dependent protease